MSDVLYDPDALARCLDEIGLADWIAVVEPMLATRLSAGAHGDFSRWHDILLSLPEARNDPGQLREALLKLAPWRKGPFDVGGVRIDSEWRSDLKWARLADAIAPLEGRRVLDVGCGNGYYALEMRKAGAAVVIGLDPTLLYILQFLAINRFANDPAIFLLPMRFEEIPPANGVFDTTFSMGVLYHQRAPIDHLRSLRDTLRPGGELVLETIFVPGEDSCASTPVDRYARMRNVWLLPTVAELTTWLTRTGYREIRVIDQSMTTTDEQRSTDWMTFESLREALDPADPTRTVEGWPAPHRVILTATNPRT